MPKSVISPVMWVVRMTEREILVITAFCKPMMKHSSSSTVSGTNNCVIRLMPAPNRPNTSSAAASRNRGQAVGAAQVAAHAPVDQPGGGHGCQHKGQQGRHTDGGHRQLAQHQLSATDDSTPVMCEVYWPTAETRLHWPHRHKRQHRAQLQVGLHAALHAGEASDGCETCWRLPWVLCVGWALVSGCACRVWHRARGQHVDAGLGLLVGVAGGEHHAFAQAELHLARSQIGHHHRQLAHQLLGAYTLAMPENTLQGFGLTGFVGFAHIQRQARSSLLPSTRSQLTILAMRRSTLAKSSMEMVGAMASPPGCVPLALSAAGAGGLGCGGGFGRFDSWLRLFSFAGGSKASQAA